MIKVLILEDSIERVRFFTERFSQCSLTITEDSAQAIDYLNERVFDYIFLDNDLGHNKGEGRNVAEFLHNNPTNLNNHASIVIHSWNMPAVRVMQELLPKSVVIPFNKNNLSTGLDI